MKDFFIDYFIPSVIIMDLAILAGLLIYVVYLTIKLFIE